MVLRTLASQTAALCCAALAPAFAQQPAPRPSQRDAPKPDVPPQVRQFWRKLAAAKTLAFTARYWMWDPIGNIPETQDGKVMRVMGTFDVKVRRPNLIAVMGTPPQEYEIRTPTMIQKGFTGGGTSLVSDGHRAISLDRLLHTYKYGPPVGDITRTSNALLVELGVDWALDPNPIEMYTLRPSAGPTDYYITFEYTDPKQPDQLTRAQFDRDTGELTTISVWDKDKDGHWRQDQRLEYAWWDCNPPLPASTFDTRVPRLYRTEAALKAELKRKGRWHEPEPTPKEQQGGK